MTDTATVPEIVLVVAAADNDAIGQAGAIPWHLPADLRHFRAITLGHPIIMGRRTFDSIGRPLPGRRNIVLSRDPHWTAPGVAVAADLDAALALAAREGTAETMVIGGADIYALARPRARRIELTRVHLSPAADRFFAAPEPEVWQLVACTDHAAADGQPACSFLSYVRRAE